MQGVTCHIVLGATTMKRAHMWQGLALTKHAPFIPLLQLSFYGLPTSRRHTWTMDWKNELLVARLENYSDSGMIR